MGWSMLPGDFRAMKQLVIDVLEDALGGEKMVVM